MYSIYADETLIYDDRSVSQANKLSNPKLIRKVNSSGSLDLTLPPTNIGYNIIKRMLTTIFVYQENEVIWSGRVLDEDVDFQNRRKLKCEGALSYLNDTIQKPKEINTTIQRFIELILDEHNANIEDNRKIYAGNIQNGPQHIYMEIDYETTLNVITKNLTDMLEHVYVSIRYQDGKNYLDISTSYNETINQITFGRNLLDFTRNFSTSDIATVIIPRGAEDEETGIRLTVESVNSGSIYVQNTEALKLYGRIEKVIDWDEITDPNELLETAQNYLNNYQFDNMVLEISAIDNHLLNPDFINAFNLLDNLRCLSTPHNLDKKFPISEISLVLDQPESTTIKLGFENVSNSSLSQQSRNYVSSSDVKRQVDKSVSKSTDAKTKEIVNNTIIKGDVMSSTFCWSRYILTEFLETNFDDIDARKTHKSLRKYIQIFDDNIKAFEAVISATEISTYKDPAGNKLYWTAIDGSDAYKFFTYESPLKTSKDKRPEGVSDSEFEEMYEVKVRVATQTTEKGRFGFPLSDGTGNPELSLGAGSGDGDRGKYQIKKDTDSGRSVYISRTDGKEYGIMGKDDGNYLVHGGNSSFIHPLYLKNVPEKGDTPANSILLVGPIGGD